MTPESKPSTKEVGPENDQSKMIAALLQRLDKLEDDNKMLKALNSQQAQKDYKNRIDHDPTLKTAYLKTIEGKPVISWETLENTVFLTTTEPKQIIERQTVKVAFLDGTTKEMPMLEFHQAQDRLTCGIASLDYIKGEAVLNLPDGQNLPINITYVNP